MIRSPMSPINLRHIAAIGAWWLLLSPFAPVQARKLDQAADASPIPTSYLKQVTAQPSPGVQVIGQGAYAWRFVVRHPERPEEPYRLASYQVRLPGGLKLANGDTAVVGTTDAQGRTAIIRVAAESQPSDWVVLPAWGQGPSGTVVLYNNGQGDGMPDIPYVLEIDTGPIYCGISLPTGHSAYLQVPESHGILQRQMESHDNCLAFQRVLNPIVRTPSLKARLAGIRRLMANPLWIDRRDLLSDKLQAIILREGSQSDVEHHVQEQVYDEWGISKAEQASRLNGIAYALLTMQPPRLLPLAHRLIEQSVALNATPENLDTKGWALHQLGRHTEALGLYAQALKGFQAMCQPDTQSAYLETMAHQAETLWTMGRSQEAIDLWAAIARNDQRNDLGESWSNGLVHWNKAKAAIQARVEEQNAQDLPVMPNCSEIRDQQ